MGTDLLLLLSWILFFIAVFHFLKSGDELPILLAVYYLFTGLNRYFVVSEGKSKWAFVKYSNLTFQFTDDLAITALNYFFLGTLVFFVSYLIFHRPKYYDKPIHNDNNLLFKEFIVKKQWFYIALFGVFTMLNTFSKLRLQNEASKAYGLSYFYLFALAAGGLILIFYLIYINLSISKIGYKVLFLGLFAFSAYSSYNPYLRFQFLSWMIALGVLFVKDMPIIRKGWVYLVGGFSVLIFFAFAGNERSQSARNLDAWGKVEFAIDRLRIAEDQNMLDGFMMVLQVYPELLDYTYGMEHFEILLRPIPRALWAGKPVGGYANKLKLNEGFKGTTVGISQSIYGTFYGEGGVYGIIIFSFLYGYLFIRLFAYADQYVSDAKYLLKGIILASLVPLLRGGDLPGIIAFIGMSYWPVIIFIFQYKKFLQQRELDLLIEAEELKRIENLPKI